MTQESPRDRANRTQLEASDPAVSAFVAASAGSGKTKLLTDRLLRLMLTDGVKPERIQCLTFTKAAAAEMSLRLQRLLGRWVTLDDAALDGELNVLAMHPTDMLRQTARALFARVLDLPGGMRIGTIHAFCQSLLRRFPLEAQLSPHFQLVDDRDAEDALTDARETMLAGAETPLMEAALETLAGLATADQFGSHVKALLGDRDRVAAALAHPDLAAAQRRALGVTATRKDDILANAVNWQDEPKLRDSARIVAALGAKTVRERAGEMLGWLSLESQDRAENWEVWRSLFLIADGKVRAPGGFVTKAVTDRHPDLAAAFLAEGDRIRAIHDAVRALKVAEISAALFTLAAPVLRAYAAHKEQSGLLDYADLIGRTSKLLINPGAAWVLYKLDGGIDHLLLDEVQDIAPQQWDIAHSLTDEFFAGLGARDARRTVFAVGDRKQSIFGFQGADVQTFQSSRRHLAGRVESAGETWRDLTLDVSFRSTRPVLDLVDGVFAEPLAAAGVVGPGETLTHFADRAGHASTVELWPLAPLPDAQKPEPWTVPHTNQGQTTARRMLAERLADWIKRQTDGSVMLESRGRPLAPGDVMVLVRRREAFATALVRELKTRGVPVAGLDRMVLTEQPAVQDLIALGDALLLPDDDLTFACLLTSPLGGLDDDDLMALAIGRSGTLAEVLRNRAGENPRWRRAWDFFATLLSRIDYATPYAILAEALGALGGRARLFARLGPEAAEPIAELLNAALSYASMHPPSLQGFLHWIRRSGAEVKREAEAAGDLVRVMTVHGAKGLQAPLVIIPDTTGLPPDESGIVWADDPLGGGAVPLWSPNKDLRCAAVDRIRLEGARRRMEEHNRLLYVALTRAEDRLVVCGWQPGRALNDASWYSLVARAFSVLPAETEPFDGWGDLHRISSPQVVAADIRRSTHGSAVLAPLPAWIGRSPDWRPSPVPAEPARPQPLAPSRPDGVDLGTVPAAASPLAERMEQGDRFRRGQLIHGLLQHLPDLPREARAAAARRYLERPGHGLNEGSAAAVALEVLAILDHPELAPLFGPEGRAEVPLTGVVGGSVVGGLVDRLAVLPDRVLVADFKTNRRPPVAVAETPVLYLRQMALYRAVLRAIFPDRRVICALVWTRDARVVILPDELLDPCEPRPAAEAA
jgi:ATP-dependent helicase/nuclease subunit A